MNNQIEEITKLIKLFIKLTKYSKDEIDLEITTDNFKIYTRSMGQGFSLWHNSTVVRLAKDNSELFTITQSGGMYVNKIPDKKTLKLLSKELSQVVESTRLDTVYELAKKIEEINEKIKEVYHLSVYDLE